MIGTRPRARFTFYCVRLKADRERREECKHTSIKGKGSISLKKKKKTHTPEENTTRRKATNIIDKIIKGLICVVKEARASRS